MKPEGNLSGPRELPGYSEKDQAGDNDTRKKVKGCINIINVVVIAWRMKSKKTVTISGTEAEYSEITDVC